MHTTLVRGRSPRRHRRDVDILRNYVLSLLHPKVMGRERERRHKGVPKLTSSPGKGIKLAGPSEFRAGCPDAGDDTNPKIEEVEARRPAARRRPGAPSTSKARVPRCFRNRERASKSSAPSYNTGGRPRASNR